MEERGLEDLAEPYTSIGEIPPPFQIKEVVFDRGGYQYHGRIKALAEGARAAGLKF